MRDNLAADFLFEMFLGLCGFGFMMGEILAADYTDYTDFFIMFGLEYVSLGNFFRFC